MTYTRAELAEFYDEAGWEIGSMVSDYHYARSLLRRLGPPEHQRFSDAGWAAGDPSMYGYDPLEIPEAQLGSILAALDWGIQFELVHILTDYDEYPPEHLTRNLEDLKGVRHNLSDLGLTDFYEEIVILHARGSRARIARLNAMVRRHDGPPPLRPTEDWVSANMTDTERYEPSETVHACVVVPAEAGNWAVDMKDVLFEMFLKDWELTNGPKAQKTRSRNRRALQDRQRSRARGRRRPPNTTPRSRRRGDRARHRRQATRSRSRQKTNTTGVAHRIVPGLHDRPRERGGRDTGTLHRAGSKTRRVATSLRDRRDRRNQTPRRGLRQPA